MDGACWVCFCCRHSPFKDMNIRIFWVCAMKCMCAQTRPRFILSSEGVFGGMEFEPMLTPREKSPLLKISPEEDRTHDAVDSEPKHYQRAVPAHIDTTKIYKLIPAGMPMTFTQGHRFMRKLKLVQLSCCLVAWSSPDIRGGWLCKGDGCIETL